MQPCSCILQNFFFLKAEHSSIRGVHTFFIHLPVNRHLDSFHTLVNGNSAKVNIVMLIPVRDSVFNYFEKIPGSRIVLVLVIWGSSILFFIVDESCCISINSVRGFQHLYRHLSLKKIISHSDSVKCFRTAVLICISLMIIDVEYIFIYLLIICTSSIKKCLFNSFTHVLKLGY